MRIKLDENLPVEAASDLHQLGHDVHTVEGERLLGEPDLRIWEAAQAEQRCLITQDLDFSDSRRFAPGTHYGIILVRLRFPSRRRLRERVAEIFRTEAVEDWQRCFVVATERKIRVRRPE